MSDRYRFGPFDLNAAEHDLRAQGKPVALTRRAFDTLLYLVRFIPAAWSPATS